MNDRYRYGDPRPGNPTWANNLVEQLRDIEKKPPLRVLREAHFAHWQRYGCVIVNQAVKADQIQKATDFLWSYQAWNPKDPETWNRTEPRGHEMKELNGSGMVETDQHQTKWDNRQTQRVYDAFVEIWDREALWVSLYRANLNTPNHGSGRQPRQASCGQSQSRTRGLPRSRLRLGGLQAD